MARFTIWEGDLCGIAMGPGDDPPRFRDGTLIDPDALPVKSFDAGSWDEACQVQYDHYGWGAYTPEPAWDEVGPDEPRAPSSARP